MRLYDFNKALWECELLPSSPRGLTGVKTRLLSAWIHASDLNVSDLVIETWQRVSHSLRSHCAPSLTQGSAQQTPLFRMRRHFLSCLLNSHSDRETKKET